MGATTFSIMTLTITIKTRDTQHNNRVLFVMLSGVMPNVVNKPLMLSVVMLNGVMLGVVAP